MADFLQLDLQLTVLGVLTAQSGVASAFGASRFALGFAVRVTVS
jgi:hypothetical protein